MTLRVLLAAVLASLWGPPAWCQYSQYSPPGQGALSEETASKEERLRSALSEARWRLGPVRLSPWLGLRQVGYVNNAFGSAENPRSDFTATVGAGLHGYLPVGRKTVVAAHALPEYVWWRDLENRRLWNWNYGIGVFGFFNRLSLEATAGSLRAEEPLNSEVEAPVNIRRDRVATALELRLHERVSLFGAGGWTEIRYRDEDVERLGGTLPLRFLDRDEERFSGGLRYHWRPNVTFSGGVESSRVGFLADDRNRSNRGTSPLAELAVSGQRFRASARVVWTRIDPTADSVMPPYRATLGSLGVGFTPGARLTWRVYGGRNLVYAYSEDIAAYTEDRVGLGLSLPVGWRTVLGLFSERGRRRTETGSEVLLGRGDSATHGATVSFLVRGQTRLAVRGSRTTYDGVGTIPRTTITRVHVTLGLSAGVSEWW